MTDSDSRLLRVGVFYDGNFFFHVSNYYKYTHARKKRISIPGLHEFIRHHVAEAEGVDVRYCHIVDAHFFRGRFSARVADARQKLYVERVFDDILMGEGVVTHYLPMRQNAEKGIDVWLALEAFELAVYKRFNVLVIIAGDSDFIPLARKVNSLGTRVMVLGWDFKFTDDLGQERQTVTSIHLLDEVTYPVMMHQIIDDKTRRGDPLVKNLFVEPKEEPATEVRLVPSPEPILLTSTQAEPRQTPVAESIEPSISGAQLAEGKSEEYCGEILSLLDGYGFIKCTAFPNNVFFHWSSLINKEFTDLQVHQSVKFSVKFTDRGPVAVSVEIVE